MMHAWIYHFGALAQIKGDHQLLGVDFDPDHLFGTGTDHLEQFGQHGIDSRHVQKVHKFCTTVIMQCQKHQIVDQIGCLQELKDFEHEQYAESGSINHQIMQTLTKADHDYHPANCTPKSPQLNQAYLCHQFWSITLTGKQNHRDMSAVLESLQSHITPSLDDELEKERSISVNLQHAQKQLQKAKQEADTLQCQHLEVILNKALAANKMKKTKASTNLIHAE